MGLGVIGGIDVVLPCHSGKACSAVNFNTGGVIGPHKGNQVMGCILGGGNGQQRLLIALPGIFFVHP